MFCDWQVVMYCNVAGIGYFIAVAAFSDIAYTNAQADCVCGPP